MTQARKDLFHLCQEVQAPSSYITLTLQGQPKVVMMSSEEFDSIMETMEILSDPETLRNIREAERDIDEGHYVTLDQLKKELGFEQSKKKPAKR